MRTVYPNEFVIVHGLDWPREGRIGCGILGRVTHISAHGLRLTCYNEQTQDFSGLDYYIAWAHVREMSIAQVDKGDVLIKKWLSMFRLDNHVASDAASDTAP